MSIIRKEQLSNPLSASYALTASYVENASFNTSGLVTTSSFNAFTASINNFTSSYNTGSFSGSFIGNLSGTASLATTASYTPNALVTASVSLNTITFTKGNGITFPITIDTGSGNSPFPYTGSARITGSLDVIGITTITGSFNVSGSTTQVGNNNLLGDTTLSGSIEISGSVNALADINLGGVLRLDPAQDPGPSNLTASYLFTSASNTAQGYDLYYRQDGNLVKFKWIEGGISTGLLYGGRVSGSGQTIYVSSGSGIIADMNAGYNQEINPIYTYVTWGNYSASATYISTNQNTYIYVDSAGVIHQQPHYFTETQYQEAICLGRVTHANYTNITGIGSNVQTTYDSDAQQSEFIRAFGPLKINGLTVSGQPGTLRINIGAGTSYNLGGFYSTNADHPSSYNSTATVTGSMARAYRSGSNVILDNNGGTFYTVIDPTQYDRDGDGTLESVGSGNWTIQRVFYNPESKRSTVYYGQERYTSLLNALQYLNTDPFTEGEFTAKSLIFVAYLVVKGNTLDLTDINNNSIIQAGLFRNTTGGSGTAGSVTLALENLSDVNITLPASNGQALIYDSGVWVNGNPTSASFSNTASYVNPLRQNVQITGSLIVSNSIDSSLRQLYDGSGILSIAWDSRKLNDNTGAIVVDYTKPDITQYFTYSNNTHTSAKLELFSSIFNYAGVVLYGVPINASLYDLVSLEGGTWDPTLHWKSSATAKLGIVITDNGNSTGDVLLEGDIVVNRDNSSIGPYVRNVSDVGLQIYIADSFIAGNGQMSETAPDNEYLRTLGHLYYNNINTNTSLYIMRFNPSNDYYRLI